MRDLGGWLRASVLALAALASVATSPPRYPRNFPAWRVFSEAVRPVGCVQATAWVAKSGKTGLGLGLELSPASGATCTIEVKNAVLVVNPGPQEQRVGYLNLPQPTVVQGYSALYIPFAFDNEKSWNDGERDARLSLELVVDGVAQPVWSLSLHHEYSGPHTDRFPR